MKWHRVVSSNVVAIGYEPEDKLLGVRFKTSTYHYHGVPETLFVDFLSASSKGRFLNRAIKKGKFPYEKVSES